MGKKLFLLQRWQNLPEKAILAPDNSPAATQNIAPFHPNRLTKVPETGSQTPDFKPKSRMHICKTALQNMHSLRGQKTKPRRKTQKRRASFCKTKVFFFENEGHRFPKRTPSFFTQSKPY